MTNLIKEETLHIDYPDISESVILNYSIAKDNGCLKFKFTAQNNKNFIYDEVSSLGIDPDDYYITSDISTHNLALISAIQNTTKYIVKEYAFDLNTIG